MVLTKIVATIKQKNYIVIYFIKKYQYILHSLQKLWWRVSSPTQQNLSILRLFYSHKMSPRSCPADSVGQSNQAHRLYQITDSCRLCGMSQREKFQNLATYDGFVARLLCFLERKMNLLQVFQGRCMYFCRRALECCVVY